MTDTAEKSASTLPDTPRNRHLFGPGPKRILAIDGGGVRGIISLTFLAQIETILRVRTQRPELRLCDYFDLIGGTSTGAIIAAGLALGYSVERLIDIYSSLSHEGFKKSTIGVGGILAPKFKEAPLTQAIHDRVQDETLGSDKLLTGLCIVAKRLDSNSVWVMHNNPLGKYYGDDNPAKKSSGIPNKDYPLRNLLRASTAAPTYFEPQSIEVARDGDKVVKGLFVDGGVSPHNNPGLLMFMVATLKGYKFCWPTGADRLMLVSVGNGSTSESPTHDEGRSMTTAFLGLKSLSSMMHDSSELNQALLQWMSRCPNPSRIDREIGDLSTDQLGPEPLLHYIRYDVELEAKWLLEKLELTYTAAELAKIGQFDRPELLPEWLKIGRRSAERHIKEGHFPAVFDAIPEPVGASAASDSK